MSLLERLRERAGRLASDPPHRQLVRAARVARDVGLAAEIPPRRAGELARLAYRRGMNVRTVHAIHALLHPDRPAVVDAGGARTYVEADRQVDRLARVARERLAVARGSPALLVTENRAEYILFWFALFRLGARAVHASWRSTPKELEYLVEHSGGRVLLVSAASLATARTVRRTRPELGLRLIVCGADADRAAGEVAYDELVADSSASLPEPPPPGEAGGNVVYTSGTTGRPKGALRDFAVFGLREVTRILERLPLHMGERHLVAAPLYHSAPQAFALLATGLGGTLHCLPHFDAELALQAISAHRIESLFLVPTMLQRILELPREVQARYPTPALHAIVVGAAEFPQPLREAAIARFGAHAIFDFYGATELGWVTLVRGDEMLARPGTVGRPLAGQRVRILDEQGRELPAGQVGLVYVANEQTMVGYLHDDVGSRAARRGAWTTVEDLGRVDADGYLYLAGRARDMVKSGGVNLYPAEIEPVLARDPQIREVAVIGVPDAEWGERLVAVVVPAATPFDVAAAEARARAELSGQKVPRRWEIVDELPRNDNGKVLKTELRARFSG